MPTILDTLIPELNRKWPHLNLRLEGCPELYLRVPAACPEVGDLFIFEEGDEAIVGVGQITHRHVSVYDTSLSIPERIRVIIDEIIWFLEALFANRVYLLKYVGGAGASVVVKQGEHIVVPDGALAYTWAGPYSASKNDG